MNKKFFTLLVLLFVFPLHGNSQIFNAFNLQFKSGAALPLKANHFEKYWNPGIHFGAAMEFSLNKMIAIKFDAAFNTFVFKHQTWKADLLNQFDDPEIVSDDFVVNGANRYILEGSVSAKLFPLPGEGNLNPYLILGAGLINMRTDELIIDIGGPTFKTELVPYINAGAGTEIAYWDGFRFFGQVVYKYALTKDENSFNFALDFSDTFEEQETHFIGIEFGIIFDFIQ